MTQIKIGARTMGARRNLRSYLHIHIFTVLYAFASISSGSRGCKLALLGDVISVLPRVCKGKS